MANEKRKATELVELFYSTGITAEQAIRCAVKHCDENIQECKYLTANSAIIQDGAMYYTIERIIYWRTVSAHLTKTTVG